MPGLLEAVATELANYELDFVILEEFRLKKVGTEWAVDFSLLFWKKKWIVNNLQDLLFSGVKYQYLREFPSLMAGGFI